MNLERKPAYNWWKPAFFIAAFAFELAREIAVISSSTPAEPISQSMVFAIDGYVQAEGSWKRIDDGEELVPNTVSIQCERTTGKCIEASTTLSERYVFAPEISQFEAKFTPEAINYENKNATCADYSVRIDLKMKKAFSVRTRKENPQNSACSKLEPRIEMQLTDGYKIRRDTMEGHFVPILSILKAVLN